MSKSDQKQTMNAANNQMSQNNLNSQAFTNMSNEVLGQARGTASALIPSITGGYSDIQSSGGFDPAVLGTVNDTFGNLATTGGISETDATSMRNRAASAAKSSYDVGAANASRLQAATGGYGVSGSLQKSLARGGSNAAAEAVTGSNADIAKLRQSGMATGASGLASVQNQMAGNKLAATSGLSNVYGMNMNQVNSTLDQILQNYKNTGTMNAQDLGILTNLANQPGVFDKIIGTIGTLGQSAAGIMGALP